MKKSRNQQINLFEILSSVWDKLLEANPFSLLISKDVKNYIAELVDECGVEEKTVQKILVETFEPDTVIFAVVGKDPELTEPGTALFNGYTKAITALEKLASHKPIIGDKTFSGFAIGRPQISLADAIQDDIRVLKQQRAKWTARYHIHLELKAEPVPKSITAMMANQAYGLFLYIKGCINNADEPGKDFRIYDVISELFMTIYSHSFFHSENLIPIKIKEMCDNAKYKYRSLQKTRFRKPLKSL